MGSSALTVKLYGTPQNRRVETETAPLEVTGPPATKRSPDPSMWAGLQVTEDSGEPSRKTSVTRRVYSEAGKLLSETTWTSWYRSEPTLVRYGTKPRPEPPKKAKPKRQPPPPPPPGEPTPPPPPPPA